MEGLYIPNVGPVRSAEGRILNSGVLEINFVLNCRYLLPEWKSEYINNIGIVKYPEGFIFSNRINL